MNRIATHSIYGHFAIIVENCLMAFKVSVLYPDNEKCHLRTFSNKDDALQYADDLAFEYRLLCPRKC